MTDTRTPAQKVIAEAMHKTGEALESCVGKPDRRDEFREHQTVAKLLVRLMIDVLKAEMKAAR